MSDNDYKIWMTQFNKESDNENGKKRKWFCKYNKKGNMFGTAGLQWKEADLITICKPSAHMQTSKNPRILKSPKSQSVQKFFFSSNVKSYFWRNFFSHLLFCQQMWHFFSSKVALVFSAFYREKVLPFWPKINGHLSAHGAHSLSTKQKDRRNILWGNFNFIQ